MLYHCLSLYPAPGLHGDFYVHLFMGSHLRMGLGGIKRCSWGLPVYKILSPFAYPILLINSSQIFIVRESVHSRSMIESN